MSTTHTRPLRDTTRREDRQQGGWWLAARFVGAFALLAVGAVHLQQYVKLYSAVPTIGALFMVNFVVATFLALALLAPIERWGGRWGGVLIGLVATSGMALATVTFVLLAISEHMPLFGFREPGYDPVAIAASRARMSRR